MTVRCARVWWFVWWCGGVRFDVVNVPTGEQDGARTRDLRPFPTRLSVPVPEGGKLGGYLRSNKVLVNRETHVKGTLNDYTRSVRKLPLVVMVVVLLCCRAASSAATRAYEP